MGKVGPTWVFPQKHIPGPQKYVKIMEFMAIIRGLGLLFYIPLGFR